MNQWEGVTLRCGEGGPPYPETCTYPNGESIFIFYGFDPDNKILNYSMLVVLGVSLRLLGFVALLAKTMRKAK